ncbi:MAG: Cof-type HAD-IIB family hydrolase [Gloeomargarita sp. DG02_1_bins_92]
MPIPDVRLLVLDLDGTVVGDDNCITPAVKSAVQAVRQRGIKVAIATGRMYRSALRFYHELELTLPLLSYQGAWIQDPHTGQQHRHWPIDPQRALELLDYFEQAHLSPHLSIHFYLNDQLYVQEMRPDTDQYAKRTLIEPILVADLRETLAQVAVAPTKVLAVSEDPQIVELMLNTLQKRYDKSELYLTRSAPIYFEAANPQVNKGVAVQYLAEELLGITAAQVVAIGDNYNDLEMLQYAGMGIAMGNAPLEVQKQADWVAPTVEEDGVVTAIKTWVLAA